MKKKLNIIHLASFKGNIGDLYSHSGLKFILDKVLSKKYSIKKLEWREFYKQNTGEKKTFNSGFVREINKFDLLVVGGGGYFDTSISDSKTGTYFDISKNIYNKIKIPVIFSSIGAIPFKNPPKNNLKKFKNFLKIIKKKNHKILLRNDGSKNYLENIFSKEDTNNIDEILDLAFFFSPAKKKKLPKLINKKKYICINLATDQIELRNQDDNKIYLDRLIDNISNIIQYCVLKMKYEVIFIPHTPQDFKIISKIFDLKTIIKLRNNIAVAPLFYTDSNLNIIYNFYKNSEFNICSRLHSNIISIISKKNHTIGLSFLKRILYLYKSIKNDKDVVDINKISLKNFKSHLIKLKQFENKKNYKLIEKKKKETFLIYKKYLNQILNSK
jgi:polysaccharide pyruvyl transferase WcaK-like protein